MTSDAMVVDVSQDWETACDVQGRFMRQVGPSIDTLSYSACCRQMRALGGDFYDFIPLRHDRMALAVGDASGKGLAAALMISNVQSSLRTAASLIEDDVAELLTTVNRQVHAASLDDRYATLFYGVYDAVTRRLHYVNAGHNPPMLIRRDGSIISLGASGVPIGIFPGSTYEEETIQLNPGDLILAYTDGVIEALNQAGEEWGVESLRNAVRESALRCADEIVHAVFMAMDDHSGGHQTDDATVVVLRVH